MTAIGYTVDTEEIIKASWSNFQHDSAAAFRLSEWSPLRPALSPKDLPGWRTEVVNFRQIHRIDHHPTESDEDSAPETIPNSKSWHNWNRDLDNRNVSNADWKADDQSEGEPENANQGPRMPRAPGYECQTKCSWFVSANTEVDENGWKRVDDRQSNGNKEE